MTIALVLACAPPAPPPPPTQIPTPLPTRAVLPTAIPTPTSTAAPSPTAPTAPVKPRTFTARDFDPFFDLYATETDGFFVTTRNARGRYYYAWDDRRWFALEERVWFRTLEDLLTVFPSRVAAP